MLAFITLIEILSRCWDLLICSLHCYDTIQLALVSRLTSKERQLKKTAVAFYYTRPIQYTWAFLLIK